MSFFRTLSLRESRILFSLRDPWILFLLGTLRLDEDDDDDDEAGSEGRTADEDDDEADGKDCGGLSFTCVFGFTDRSVACS